MISFTLIVILNVAKSANWTVLPRAIDEQGDTTTDLVPNSLLTVYWFADNKCYDL